MRIRPEVAHDVPVVLPLAGIYISCIIPKLLHYEHFEAADESYVDSPLHSHFIVEDEDESMDLTGFGDGEEDGNDDEAGESVLVQEGKFVVARRQRPPSPSFGDLLLSKRTFQSTPFEVRVDRLFW